MWTGDELDALLMAAAEMLDLGRDPRPPSSPSVLLLALRLSSVLPDHHLLERDGSPQAPLASAAVASAPLRILHD